MKPLVRARGKEHVFSGSQEGQNNSHCPIKSHSTFEKQKQLGKIDITNGLGMRQVASFCTSRKSIGQCRHWFGHWLCWHHSHMLGKNHSYMLGKGRRIRFWGVNMAEWAWLKDWMSNVQYSGTGQTRPWFGLVIRSNEIQCGSPIIRESPGSWRERVGETLGNS